jgi:ParB/RepB/Spo0J family partition protein
MTAASFAGKTSLVQEIPLNAIFADANQVRRKFDEEALTQLADSIREHGVIQPIVVRPIDKTGVAPFEIIAGERRWRASQAAGRETIPAVIRVDLVGQDVSVLQILENLQRADLTLQETAAGVAKLVEAVGNTKAAQQLGKSEGWVSKHASIGALPEDVRALVDAGAIESADLAHELGQILKREPEGYWPNMLLEKAGEGTLTRADTRHRLEALRAQDEREKEEARKLKEAEKRDAAKRAAPEFAAKQAKIEAEEREQKKQMDAAAAAREARRAQIEALDTECRKRLAPMIPLIERALGVSVARISESEIAWSADYAYDDDFTDGNTRSVFAIEPLTPSPWDHEIAVPAGPESTRYRISLDLDHRQLMQLIKAIAPGKPAKVAESPEKQGELTIGSFIAECLAHENGAKTKAGDVYAAYAAWCRKNRLDAVPLTHNAWGEAIAAAGIDKHRLKTGWHYLGVKLKG